MLHIHRILTIIMMGITTSTVYGALKTSIVNFQGVPGNSIEASDGIIWTITTDAASVDYDETLGVCYRSVSYVHFHSSDYSGKLLRLTVNASGTGSPILETYYASYSSNRPLLSESPNDYVFCTYTQFQDYLDLEISRSNSQRFSIKSIEVVYDDEATPALSTVYEQVTDISQLAHNDEIIIAYQDGNVYRAMSLTFNGYNRSTAELTRNEDGTFNCAGGTEINWCPILLENAEQGYWYLRAQLGYIYDGSGISTKALCVANTLEKAQGDNAKVKFTFNNEGKANINFPLDKATKYISLYFDNNPKSSSYRCILCNNSSTPLCIFRKVKQEPATISVTFKEKFGGWTSLYYKDKNLVVPNDFTAYAYSVSNGEGSTSTPYETGDVIPKDTPVLLKLKEEYAEYDEDKTRTVTVVITNEEGEAADENALLGSEDGGTTTVDGITEGFEFFRLTLNAKSEEGSIGFYWGADNGGSFTIGAHKAYLALPKPQSSTTSYIPLRILPYLLGDANGDGQVNVADIMVVINYIIGNRPSIIKMKRSDVNFDQDINVTDAMGIVKIILNEGAKRLKQQ